MTEPRKIEPCWLNPTEQCPHLRVSVTIAHCELCQKVKFQKGVLENFKKFFDKLPKTVQP